MITSFAVYPAGRGRGAVLETPNGLSAPAIISKSPRHVKPVLSDHAQRDDLRNAPGQDASISSCICPIAWPSLNHLSRASKNCRAGSLSPPERCDMLTAK